jgi:hypothetical protein
MVTEGLRGSGFFFGGAALIMLGRMATLLPRKSSWKPSGFALYITLIGLLSAGIYVIGRCGADSALRYDLLSLLGATGLAAWFIRAEPNVWFRRFGMSVVIAWALLTGSAHGRIWSEYELSQNPPVPAKQMIIRHLEARGIHYAEADYWIAYYVTFLTNERIVVKSNTFTRIREYGPQVDDHSSEAILVSRRPCDGGERIMDGVYFCRPDAPIH